jgi:4-amino-4-deoxy-L-arabinose transferase-like glycosyltransferase
MALPAVYLLGRELGGRRAGIIAALLLAITPAFSRWVSAGYVDVPMAAFYTVGVLYTVRFWRSGTVRDALLAGALIGLAALTKNAGLIGVGLFGAALLVRALTDRRTIPAALIGLAVCAAITAPWYVRNLIGAGFLIPDTAWTDQAERTLSSLLIYITLPDNFAATGWVILAAIVWLARCVLRWRASPTDAAHAGLILWFTVPFFAAWWLFVSYDPRFVMLFTPILCAAGGSWLVRVVDAGQVSAFVWRLTAALALALIAFNLWIAVEYKDDILRNPLMSHADKVALVRGG